MARWPGSPASFDTTLKVKGGIESNRVRPTSPVGSFELLDGAPSFTMPLRIPSDEGRPGKDRTQPTRVLTEFLSNLGLISEEPSAAERATSVESDLLERYH